jgi:hypothetical protein
LNYGTFLISDVRFRIYPFLTFRFKICANVQIIDELVKNICVSMQIHLHIQNLHICIFAHLHIKKTYFHINALPNHCEDHHPAKQMSIYLLHPLPLESSPAKECLLFRVAPGLPIYSPFCQL